MADYNLDFNEGIIIETDGVRRSGNGGNVYVKKMLLTNKNIIYVTSQKTGGIFSKSVDVVDKIPLSEVKVIDGQVFVVQKKTDLFTYALQIQFVNGTEEYSYGDGSKKITNQWVSELNRLLGNGQSVQNQGEFKKAFFGGVSDLASSVGTIAGTLGQTVSSAAKQAADQAGIAYENTKTQIESKMQEQARADAVFQQVFASQQHVKTSGGFCVNCGTRLDSGAKFCPECGTAVKSATTSEPLISAVQQNPEMRQHEYAGKIIKCPNCGAVINQTTAICPQCGHRITGQAAVSSVQLFESQLMALESRRKKSALGMFNVYAGVDPVDKQKLALIQNFPIPNTIDDILEFILLAVSNIDVTLSKKSWSNRSSNMQIFAMEMPKVISDAWVAKMQQVYQKAEILFPDDPMFVKIKQIYTDKMVELKLLKK